MYEPKTTHSLKSIAQKKSDFCQICQFLPKFYQFIPNLLFPPLNFEKNKFGNCHKLAKIGCLPPQLLTPYNFLKLIFGTHFLLYFNKPHRVGTVCKLSLIFPSLFNKNFLVNFDIQPCIFLKYGSLIPHPHKKSFLLHALDILLYDGSEVINSSRTDAISESLSSNPLLSLLAHYAHMDFLDFFSSLNRRNLRIITSFLDNKAPLKKLLHHIGLTTDSLCDLCSEPDQDNAHILYSCPPLILQRLKILGSYTIIPNSSPPHPQLLLDFLLSTPTYSCYAPLHEQ